MADSHLNMLQGVRDLLGSVFATVMMVADGPSLFAAIDRCAPELAIVDLSLSSVDGNVARNASKRYSDLSVIVLSVHDEPAARNAALSAGAKAFVLKRDAARELLPTVQRVLSE